jgi:hypothetical protein
MINIVCIYSAGGALEVDGSRFVDGCEEYLNDPTPIFPFLRGILFDP